MKLKVLTISSYDNTAYSPCSLDSNRQLQQPIFNRITMG